MTTIRTIRPPQRYLRGKRKRYPHNISGGRAFSPASIAGLQLWLKADAITGLNDGDPVATWSDSSGNGRDATQSTPANRPTYKVNIVNGRPVVRFAAANSQSLNLPNFLTGFSAGEIFIVIKITNDPTTGVGAGGLWEFGSDAAASHYCFTDGIIYDAFGTTARKTTVNPTPTLAAWRLYNVSSAAGAWTSRLDTAQLFTTGTNTVGWTTTPKFATSGAGAFFTDGDIAELILYSSVLSTTDRSSLSSHLSAKYALSF